MFSRLGLRLRIFLFFCLLGLGGMAIVAGALMLGHIRAGEPDLAGAFIFSGVLAGFLFLGLVAGVWFLFDENVARPIDRLAATLRARAHAGATGDIDLHGARFLGDLAPAAQAVTGQLMQSALDTAGAVATETARLQAERDRLTALLTDIPVAMMIVSPAHRIVLYDGQAAEVLAQVAPPRLDASVFDYFDRKAVEEAHDQLIRTGREVTLHALGARGAQGYDARLKPLGGAPGYMLVIDAEEARIAPEAARPLVYDFGLLDTPGDELFENRPLSGLCYVAFDTETTGLLPHKDAVLQIGAVRILRGRPVEGEELDLLVDPGRPIPPASTKVHHITDAMVSGAPDIAEAGRRLHDFARDAVLVAHNAPFDMAFLRNDAGRMGVTWDHPILDTVLLSAVLFGPGELHTLDALCDRLDIRIAPEDRHTALGDARATGLALCRMLPMLEARGMKRFGDVIAETRRHGRLLEDLN